ncbi:MAG: hypothetical protein C7B45_10315 [Sulfobacillus acidophilus]|uniref:GIY-YIG domain-containing protein n=1 Tax=Sulfobacillus acidophilus TaxID=53633 RepID=A0A2T2WH95_9FIRM|nr:MAG: hypothetical protein C7B45_10315 [Sulfobacillus acidophilus]
MASSLKTAEWSVYLIRCGDGTFYTGIAVDVQRRFQSHCRGRGARYTRGRGPLQLCWWTGPLTHGEALKAERRIKRWPHARKAALVDAQAQGGEPSHG